MFRSDLCSSPLDRGPSSSFAVWMSRMFSSPVSTALKAIGVGDICLVCSIERDTLPSTMFHSHHRSHRERNMLWPSSIGWKDVVVSSYEQCVSGVRNQTEWGHCAFVIMCPKSFSTAGVLSMIEQETYPYFSPHLSERKVSSYICLHQLGANFWVKIIVPCVSEKSSAVSTLLSL